jgi:putative endonuclease
MPKVFTSKTQKTGELGETIACMYLEKHGFTIVERNYYKKLGEIDIVAQKDKTVHFIEVKTVSHETVSRIRAEDNFTAQKIMKFKKIVACYLAERRFPTKKLKTIVVTRETPVQIDLLAVYLDSDARTAKIKPFWNIII